MGINCSDVLRNQGGRFAFFLRPGKIDDLKEFAKNFLGVAFVTQ